MCLQSVKHCLVIIDSRATSRSDILNLFNSIFNRKLRVSQLEFFSPFEFLKSPADSPVEIFARALPRKCVANDSLSLHSSRSIVQVCKFMRNVEVDRLKLLLTIADLSCKLDIIRVGLKLVTERAKFRVESSHGFNLISLSVLDLTNSRRFKDTTSRFLISVHFHVSRVYCRIDDNPGSASKLTTRGNVDEDGLFVVTKRVDNLSTELQNLTIHISGSSRKASPVSKNDQRKIFTTVKVFNSLSSFVRGVREPNLSSLRFQGLP
mmetsp:Transcript_7702/g.11931  ORF Transcript_7702/g.11931 Transcript_7702/m.11931 type:complete len:264 (-) Transcript_7702:1704-2495(-)